MTFGLAVFSMQSYNLSAADSNRESSGEADLGARFDAASGGEKAASRGRRAPWRESCADSVRFQNLIRVGWLVENEVDAAPDCERCITRES